MLARRSRLRRYRLPRGIVRFPSECQPLQPPIAWEAVQGPFAENLEPQTRTGHQVFDRARDQDLAGPSVRRDPRGELDDHAAEVLADSLALAGVQPRAHLE